MKKIFRMALVFALAGAALLYTGCTKDYNEDINNLAGQINDLKSTHATDIANLNSALNNLESSLKSADAAIEAAYKKADDALAQSLKDAEGKIAANEDAINGLKGDVKSLQDDVNANADDIKALNDDITKLAEDVAKDLAGLETKLTGAFQTADADLQKQIDDNLADAKNSLDEAKKLLLNELRSIVAIPQAYVEGVEATEYGYANVEVKDMVKAPKEGAKVYESTAKTNLDKWIEYQTFLQYADPEFSYASFPEGAEYAVAAKVDKDKKPVVKTVGQLATAYYDLNPSSFDTKKAEWALYPNAVPFIKVKADAKAWKPVFDTIEPVEKSNDFAVKYYVENPELLAADFAAKKLPTMELVASLDKERDITSNDLVLYAFEEDFEALAFDSANKNLSTVNQCRLGSELYNGAFWAIYFPSSLACDYRKTLDLAKLVTIHMNKDGKEYETTLAKLKEVYTKLSMTFELVDYTVGENKTSQSAYAKINGSVFQPKTVSGEVSESTNSPVGKKPLVLVKLFNGEDIALAGYFKVEIVRNADVETINFPSFGTIPFMCKGAEFATTYDQFSDLIIDGIGIPYGEFKNNYSVANTKGGYTALTDKKSIECQVFVENEKGEKVATDKYGKITYTVDDKGAVNDRFDWVLDFDAIEKIGAGKSATVYVELFDQKFSRVYVSFSVSVAPKAHYDFGANKEADKWYDDVEGEAFNTIRVNVEVNAKENADVADFSKSINSLFLTGKPAIKLSEASNAVYFDKDGKAITDAIVEYQFSKAQPVVDSYKLVYGPDTKLVGATNKELYVEYKAKADDKNNSYALVATLDGDVISYATTDMAKKLLNEQVDMLYANVQANVAYGTENKHCVPCDTTMFHARFLRPLTIEWSNQTINEESQTDGANVDVIAFFKSITDWNHQNVIDVNLEKKTWKDHEEKSLNMFTYYQFKTLTIDLKNATRDNADISDLTKKVKISETGDVIKLGTLDDNKLFTEGSYPDGVIKFAEKASIENLEGIVINYKNSDVNSKGFTIYIPATIEYYWGKFETTLQVKIQNTEETKPL